MSVEEDAARLRAIDLPFALCQQIKQAIEECRQQARSILGDVGTGFGEISGATEQALTETDNLYSALKEMESRLENSARRLTQG